MAGFLGSDDSARPQGASGTRQRDALYSMGHVRDDGTYHGQPYKHNYASIFGAEQFAQIFTIRNQDKIVDKLEIPWNVFHTDNQLLYPNDNLYYFIRESNQFGNIIANGTFLTTDEIYNTGTGNGAGDRRWYGKTLAAPITLEKDKTYFMSFSSPKSNITAHWGTDTPNAFAEYESGEIAMALNAITFDGTNSYFKRTNNADNPWDDNRNYLSRDLSFRFHNIDNLEGSLTSISKDAEYMSPVGYVFKEIKFEGSIPSDSYIDIYLKSSSDDSVYSEWELVIESATPNTTYEIPINRQERYVSWKLVFKTNSSSITPEIYNVTLFAEGESNESMDTFVRIVDTFIKIIATFIK